MHDETGLIQAILQHPDDDSLRLVFADWLEERADPRAELLRLLHTLTRAVEVPHRPALEKRLRTLLSAGVPAIGPFFTNSIGTKFAWIPAGTFLMGSPDDEEGRGVWEIQRKVTLTKGFFLAINPTTQASWREIMGNNPSDYYGDDHPVEQVSWDDCQAFLRKLGERDGHAYRLPTEAEWEYACRAGTTTAYYFGETISTAQANYSGDYSPNREENEGDWRGTTTPVASFAPNAFGLYDMHGNVCEWCEDWCAATYEHYRHGVFVDPRGPQDGVCRVLRGGSFCDFALGLRSADRNRYGPSVCSEVVGFRAAMTFS